MTVIAIGAAGIAAVLMAVQLKGMKGEYATYLIIAAGFFIFFYGISKLESIMDTVERIQGYIRSVSPMWRSLPPVSARMRALAPLARRSRFSASFPF